MRKNRKQKAIGRSQKAELIVQSENKWIKETLKNGPSLFE